MFGNWTRKYISGLAALVLLAMAPHGSLLADAEHAEATGAPFQVSADIALASLISLGDGHLQKMADALHILASSDAGRSADWERIREPYAELAMRNITALNWFALPDGSYWSVQDGREPGNLAGRDYFPKALAGETVIGELVISRATGKPVAIIAVPVTRDDTVVGVFGASVYLDELSDVIRRQMSVDDGLIFYSFDHDGMVALVWDRGLIFFEPRKSGDEALARAFDEMLARESGIMTYRFRDHDRTVVFQKSASTGWWYAFGELR